MKVVSVQEWERDQDPDSMPMLAFSPPDIDTDTFARDITRIAKASLLRDGYLTPVANVLGFQDGKAAHFVLMLAPFMDTPERRGLLTAALPEILTHLEAFCVVLVTEAWSLRGPNAIAERQRYGSAEKHPDRIEIMSIISETSKSCLGQSFPILRDADGKITGLGEGDPPAQVAGQFSHLLRVPPEQMN